ncbi:uncharacterized protein LOC107867771 [Capsicum annuum]|uniref:uncharacterized protein LOC107867771 n=1 Tax=Capsicum annuum TaxID=4072 RepID=UPI0007BEC703|nr:uncharacterized protein LOC107867771 [Capsicum annuum]XP_016569660.1 uncharacterized protein LOC107867771 [Capsicum annuum]XP_016569661.1 uncharacterized protein LOC107867771 [Capsicum annuum]XP_047266301.1 uncharacterized protein LOC107867771 [Capsicum annuum]XP_047266302.1 uncharacterized protein LOC107867771 [Capsicum annuum]
MPPPSDKFHTSSFQNSLHSSSSSVPSISSTPSFSGLRIGGPNTSTSPFIDSDTVSNATAPASQNLQFKEVLEYDKFGRLRIITGGDGILHYRTARGGKAEILLQIVIEVFIEILKWGVDVPLAKVFEETHKKKNSDGTREDGVEPHAKDTY